MNTHTHTHTLTEHYSQNIKFETIIYKQKTSKQNTPPNKAMQDKKSTKIAKHKMCVGHLLLCVGYDLRCG